ncbi:MAG: hypothetical protein ACYDCK_07010 [Thermoplasmatota archaeon]
MTLVGADPRDKGSASVTTTLIAFAICVLAFAVTIGIVTETPARSAASAQGVSLVSVAANAMRQLTETSGTPVGWCEDGIAPLKIGLATGNGTHVADLCNVRALRSTANTPAGREALRANLGLAASSAPSFFHLRLAPQGAANASGSVAALVGMRILYVGHGAGLSEAPESAYERTALETLGLNFTDTPIDTTGALAAGDHASDIKDTLTRAVAPRLAGFDFTENDGFADGSYWKILNTSRYVEDAALPGSSASVFGSPPTRHHVATVSFLAPDQAWHVTADPLQPRDFRLVALVNLTGNPLTQAELDFDYHLDTGATTNVATVEACVFPCRSPVVWTPLASLKNAGDTVRPSDYSEEKVSLSGLNDGVGCMLYLAFTYHVGPSQSQTGPASGFFFTHPRIVANGATVVPDWLDGTTNRSLGALVVGSNVDQSQFLDPVLDRALADYVNASGELVALGSASAQGSWLSDLVAPSPIATVSAPLTASGDPTHPVLTDPFTLHYADYDVAPRGYTEVEGWNAILFSGAKDANGAPVPTLQVALPSVGRNGTAILTSYRPGASAISLAERADAFADMLLEGRLRSAFIDYGDTIPHVTHVADFTRALMLTLDGRTNEATTPTRVLVSIWVW